MDSNAIIFALAGVISTLAGLYAQELRASRDGYKQESRDSQEQLRLNTEAMRELSAFVRDTMPLLAEFRILLPTIKDLMEEREETPAPKPRTRRQTP